MTVDQRSLARLGRFPGDIPRADGEPAAAASAVDRALSSPFAPTALSCDTLPPAFPALTINSTDSTTDECYFLAPFSGSLVSHLVVLDGLGTPVYYRNFPAQTRAHDFKLQQGLPTVWLEPSYHYFVLDSSYAVVDSFRAGNGYTTDSHGFQLLPNGHALIQIIEGQFVDVSAIVPGGNPHAWVIGYGIQELDASKNVIFQWRSFDHYQITDCVSQAVSLTDSVIDYVHGNAVEEDTDGNVIISARHLSEITKIDRATGDILWRLGLNAKNNQFNFPNDTRGCSLQHDVRRIPNGDLTIFDNGNDNVPQYSRAVEYQVDEANKVATLVWEHRESPDVYTPFMGNVQRHADGGTTIGWGGTNAGIRLTDVRADGSTGFSMTMPLGVWTYRGFRFPWQTNRFATDVSSLDFGAVDQGGSRSMPVTVRNTSSSDVTITCLVSSDSAFQSPTPVPFTLAPGDSATIAVEFSPVDPGVHDGRFYIRQVTHDELVAREIRVTGTETSPVGVGGGAELALQLNAARPSPFRSSTVIHYSLPRAQQARLEVYDVRGRLIRTLASGLESAGGHDVVWRPSRGSHGLYFVRLWTESRTLTRKVAFVD